MSATAVTPPPKTVTVPQPTSQSAAAATTEKPPGEKTSVAPPQVALTAHVATAPAVDEGEVVNPFAGAGSFALAQRMANLLAASTVVPKEYQGNVGNCLIAIEIAGRIGMPALMVMQNMVPVYGKPSWTSKFLIGVVNASPEWTPIRWRWVGKREDGDSWGVRAVATDKRTGEECIGPLVDIAMAKAEGWYDRRGKVSGEAASKWPTMPELMLMYRSAAFWSRLYIPEKTLGLTTEEVEDIGGTVRPGSIDVTSSAAAVMPPSKTLAEVTARSREQRGHVPTASETGPTVVVAAAKVDPPVKAEPPRSTAQPKPEDVISRPTAQVPNGQATLPIRRPAPRGISVQLAGGTPVNLDDEDAAARAAVAPTDEEIAANGPPPISDEDLPPWPTR